MDLLRHTNIILKGPVETDKYHSECTCSDRYITVRMDLLRKIIISLNGTVETDKYQSELTC